MVVLQVDDSAAKGEEEKGEEEKGEEEHAAAVACGATEEGGMYKLIETIYKQIIINKQYYYYYSINRNYQRLRNLNSKICIQIQIQFNIKSKRPYIFPRTIVCCSFKSRYTFRNKMSTQLY